MIRGVVNLRNLADFFENIGDRARFVGTSLRVACRENRIQKGRHSWLRQDASNRLNPVRRVKLGRTFMEILTVNSFLSL